ncbi:MAG: BatA domain-containing protein [Nitrospinae bacterium]|nr:BatA domain-containing protein [Nitrospinota bacterium]
MNLNFLSPIFLFGLLGIAIPILIHLMTRRQKKHIRFSAVYLLFQSQKRSVKKAAPNRLLLLLIRCLAILLLSLALAHPIFSFSGPADLLPASPSASVFILDDSYSMGMRSEDGALYDLAVSALLKTVRKIPVKSAYSIVLASSSTRLLQDWTEDPSLAEKLLKTSKPSFQTTSIGKAMTMALQLLESATQKEKQIFIFTDMDKNGWNENEFLDSELANKRYPVTLVDFSALRTGQNRAAVQQAEVSQEFLTNSRVIRVKSKVANLLPDRPINGLDVSLSINGKQKSQKTLKFAAGEEVIKEFTFPLKDNEAIQGAIEIPDDALSVDNKRFFSFQPDQKIKVLVVDGDPKTVAHQRESFYVEKALNPFTVALSNIEPTISTLEELQVRNLFDFSAVMLCNVRDLPFDYERQLEKYVQRGGALFIALGDQIDPKYYNENLGNLLPVSIASLHQVGLSDEPFRFDLKKSAHPVLKVFKGKSLEEMKSIRFNSLYSVEPRENRKYTVPLRFTNQYPAVVESDFGKGKVILYVSSVDRDWNNFPIQPTFLPWIQRWIKYSARGLESILHSELLVGEAFEWTDTLSDSLLFVESPDGKITQLAGTSYDETFLPGVYRLFRKAGKENSATGENAESRIVSKLPDNTIPAGTFTVNIDTRESVSEKITEEEVRKLLGNMQVQFSSGADSHQTADASSGFPLATPFLLLVAGMLLWEGFMIRRE